MAVNSLEKLMDVPVDHYISIDMDSVKTVVDELGWSYNYSNGSFITKKIVPIPINSLKRRAIQNGR